MLFLFILVLIFLGFYNLAEWEQAESASWRGARPEPPRRKGSGWVLWGLFALLVLMCVYGG